MFGKASPRVNLSPALWIIFIFNISFRNFEQRQSPFRPKNFIDKPFEHITKYRKNGWCHCSRCWRKYIQFYQLWNGEEMNSRAWFATANWNFYHLHQPTWSILNFANYLLLSINEQVWGGRKISADGIMLIRRVNSGTKVHWCICCFLEETRKAPNSRYVLIYASSSLIFTIALTCAQQLQIANEEIFYCRLGWHRQDQRIQRAPTSIYRLVLRSCCCQRPSHLPPQNRWCWPSHQGPRFNQEPWFQTIPPRQRLWICWPSRLAIPREDRCFGARWGEGRSSYHSIRTTWFGPYRTNHRWGRWGRRWRVNYLHHGLGMGNLYGVWAIWCIIWIKARPKALCFSLYPICYYG